VIALLPVQLCGPTGRPVPAQAIGLGSQTNQTAYPRPNGPRRLFVLDRKSRPKVPIVQVPQARLNPPLFPPLSPVQICFPEAASPPLLPLLPSGQNESQELDRSERKLQNEQVFRKRAISAHFIFDILVVTPSAIRLPDGSASSAQNPQPSAIFTLGTLNPNWKVTGHLPVPNCQEKVNLPV
jgi:hypothetical protein